MFEIVEQQENLKARIKVIGIGGGGGNAVNTMIGSKFTGVDFYGREYGRPVPRCEPRTRQDSTR